MQLNTIDQKVVSQPEQEHPIQGREASPYAGCKLSKHRPEILDAKGRTIGHICLARKPKGPSDWVIPALPHLKLEE